MPVWTPDTAKNTMKKVAWRSYPIKIAPSLWCGFAVQVALFRAHDVVQPAHRGEAPGHSHMIRYDPHSAAVIHIMVYFSTILTPVTTPLGGSPTGISYGLGLGLGLVASMIDKNTIMQDTPQRPRLHRISKTFRGDTP